MREIGIYVHIPFCKQKCLYCDFCSFCAGKQMQEEYFQLLEKEIEKKSGDFHVKSIYFGGGTPSSVDERHIVSVLNKIKSKFKIIEDAEITIECNPCSVDLKKLEAYKRAGFNRISFGVQSFDDKVLKSVGRLHTAEQADEAVKLAQKVGFENISCDLMIGLPYQTKDMLLSDVNKLEELGVDHISSYMLQLEEGTPICDLVANGNLKVASEEEQVDLYEKVVKRLKLLGYEQYEVSNFAKNGKYSKHNLNYWQRGEYLGFGLSAHSFLNEKRFANPTTFDEYENDEIAMIESLSKEDIVTELIMLGLRYFDGIDLEKLSVIDSEKVEEIKQSDLVKKGIIKIENERAILDPKFYAVNNEIMLEFI